MREYLDAAVFKDMILCADAALAENTQQINELNVFPVPDGDTGTNMGLTMNEAAAQLRKKEFYAVDAVADWRGRRSSARRTRKLRRYTVAPVPRYITQTQGNGDSRREGIRGRDGGRR